jgi:hypothetical protein
VEASIVKDADCLTKMYAPRRDKAAALSGSFEDLLDSPFRELGLLEPTDFRRSHAASRWQFTNTARTSLAPELVAYACLDYAARGEPERQSGSIALARLANEPGGPGRAFRLREPEIAQVLSDIANLYPERLKLAEGIGQRSLHFEENPKELAWDVLDSYYTDVRGRPGFPDRETWYTAQPPGMVREMRRRHRTDLISQPTLDRLAGALV